MPNDAHGPKDRYADRPLLILLPGVQQAAGEARGTVDLLESEVQFRCRVDSPAAVTE